ncbi:hypothetical protein IWX92DRAFT_365621 [Phyllosticta citricarpa]
MSVLLLLLLVLVTSALGRVQEMAHQIAALADFRLRNGRHDQKSARRRASAASSVRGRKCGGVVVEAMWRGHCPGVARAYACAYLQLEPIAS